MICCLVFNAAAEGIQVKSAELVPIDNAYQLNADFDIDLSPEVEAALNKGVPLTFLIEFQLVSPRQYWFDDEITTKSQLVLLSYHALSRQYLINIDQHQKSFTTLQEVRDELSRLRDWVVLDKSDIVKGESYQAMLRFRLDHSRLPKALQVEALSSEKWTLVSERYRWVPNFQPHDR
ncbi:MAG TPA: DUF4390 domain-containing protein [Methylophilaceae bacterium]|nr:DUF4390 domain-containing protein [Methylophilaceae bacterium]